MDAADPSGGEARGRHLGRTVASSASATMVVFGVDRLLQLVFVAVLGRLLSPEDFGVVAAAMVFIAFIQIFSELGVSIALTQALRVTERMIVVANSIVLFATLLLLFAAFATAPIVAAWFRNPDLVEPVRLLCLLLLFQSFGIVPQALLLREFRARDLSLFELASGIFGNLVVAVPMALAGFSYWSLIAGVLAQAAGKSLFLNLAISYPRRIGWGREEARQLLFKGTGFSLATVFNTLALQADNLIVGRYLSAHALGLYSRAYVLMQMPTKVYRVVVDRTFFPAMAHVQDQPERLRSGYLNGVALTATVGLPMSLFVTLLAPEIIAVVLGGQWGGAVLPFQILCYALFFRLSYAVSGTVLRATGAAYRLAAYQVVYAALMVGGCLLAYPYGIEGVAAAVSLVIGAMWLMVTASALRLARTGIGAYVRAHGSGAAAAALVAASAFPAAWACRSATLGPLIALLSATAAAGAALLIGSWLAPRLFLGSDGQALVRSLSEISADRLSALRRWRKS